MHLLRGMTDTNKRSDTMKGGTKYDTAIENIQAHGHIIEALVAAMNGEPENYSYDGEVQDTSAHSGAKCACGHPVRYLFILRHKDNASVICCVGSVCINTAPYLDAAMVARMNADLEALKAMQKEEIKKIKAAQAQEAVEAKKAEWTAIKDRIAAAKETASRRGCRVVYEIYNCWKYYPRTNYKTAKGQIRAYDSAIKFFEEVLKSPLESNARNY